MMEEQLEKKKAEIAGVKVSREKVRELLGGFEREDGSDEGEAMVKERSEVERWRNGQRAVWAALDEDLMT
jgi:hypothetical protein